MSAPPCAFETQRLDDVALNSGVRPEAKDLVFGMHVVIRYQFPYHEVQIDSGRPDACCTGTAIRTKNESACVKGSQPRLVEGSFMMDCQLHVLLAVSLLVWGACPQAPRVLFPMFTFGH